MNGAYDDPVPDDAQGPRKSIDFEDDHNRRKAISRRDINALVELKRLRKAL